MGLLTGKTAIITGAARGIGKAVAMKFAQEGANIAFTDLVLNDDMAAGLEATRKEIEAYLHQLRIKGFKTQIFILSELDKAVHCRGIAFCRPSPFLPLQFIDTSLHEVEHTLYRRDFPERSHDIINGVFHTGPLQIIDNTL